MQKSLSALRALNCTKKIKTKFQKQPKEFKVFNMEAHGVKLSFQYSNEDEFKQICEYMKETATLFGNVEYIKEE